MITRRALLVTAAASAVAAQTACVPNAGRGTQAASSSSSGISSTTTLGSAPKPTFVAPLVPQAPRTVLEGLDSPWQIAFLPRDDASGQRSALLTSRDTGVVFRVDVPNAQGGTAQKSEVARVPEVYHGGEGGLLGIALSPDYSESNQVYVYRTVSGGNQVISTRDFRRFETVIEGIPRSRIHNGGRMVFGPDGALYVGTGDAGRREVAQELEKLGGKILRHDPSSGKTTVYSLGHRNVQGLAFTSSGELWATELGPDKDDELQRIYQGGNYGWPLTTGYGTSEVSGGRSRPAHHVWESTADASPSGLAISGQTAYVAALRGQRLWVVSLPKGLSHDADTPIPAGPLPQLDPPEFKGSRLRDVAVTPDGKSLWILTDEGPASRLLVAALA
ncbi:PQQ-dependent sugar dehydrogenase [Neomicrococcus lactis]|uniref:Glucose/arabinose dehydrogenase n=1 Tax=Neomicrococcus lactis TaxID=732241 RepID=A0A7W9DC68_9MICC|nr:PQQ-dependent sugar dehydrogenase [Neomicrococcus lactis]MBB5598851.1 glucose/arabinose dehydrogenase [Neomicrococcus lactis]